MTDAETGRSAHVSEVNVVHDSKTLRQCDRRTETSMPPRKHRAASALIPDNGRVAAVVDAHAQIAAFAMLQEEGVEIAQQAQAPHPSQHRVA